MYGARATKPKTNNWFRTFILFFFSAVILTVIGFSCVLINKTLSDNYGTIEETLYGGVGAVSYSSRDISIPSLELTKEQYKIRNKLKYTAEIMHPSDVRMPELYPLGELLSSWPSDDVSPDGWLRSPAHPNSGVSNGFVARFDYHNEHDKEMALRYRNVEVPFILYNLPELDDVSANVFSQEALLHNMGSYPMSVEKSESNHFMYYNKPSSYKRAELKAEQTGLHKKGLSSLVKGDWVPPQDKVQMTFREFLAMAHLEEVNNGKDVHNRPLYYLTLSATEGRRLPWIANSLKCFDNKKPSFFIVDPRENKGINCRFGMKGVAAAAHYDGGRNFIAMLRGRKRYVILPPSECPKLDLLPRGHPSARHSAIDWTNASEIKARPLFASAKSTEVVVSQGEMLYLPSYWFHYIVSQDMSIQCNARSGTSGAGAEEIDTCGFDQKGVSSSKEKHSKKQKSTHITDEKTTLLSSELTANEEKKVRKHKTGTWGGVSGTSTGTGSAAGDYLHRDRKKKVKGHMNGKINK